MTGSKGRDDSTTLRGTLDGVRPTPQLLVLWDGGFVRHALPERGSVVLGRGGDCDVTIDHTSVSRRHACVRVGEAGYEIDDLGSANGTWIDEKRIARGEKVRVEGGQVRLGATTLILPPLRSAVAPAEPIVAPAGSKSPALAALYERVDLVARGKLAVLVIGETGSGKELVARELHKRSPRAKQPFVTLNCTAFGEALLEREIFGATELGAIERAEGGTLFLDEVGDLPPAMQARLLHVIETGEATRVGSAQPRRIDVRVVAATNKDPDALVAKGALRADLYFRLAGAKLHVPPLRERREDIARLAREFAAAASAEIGKPAAEVTTGALSALLRHDWPGNVRELKNVIERAVLLGRAGPIRAEHLALDAPSPQGVNAANVSDAADGRGSAPAHDLRAQISALERDRILAALAQCNGNQSRAAKLLGISRRTLITRIEMHQLPRPRKRSDEP